MKKYMKWVVVPALFVVFMAPGGAQAATYYYYQPAPVTTVQQQQQIAYLYSLVAQLQMQLNALLASGQTVSNSYTNSSSYVSVKTDSVADAASNGVEFSGTVNFKRSGDATVWFEYGLTSALSYSTESKIITNRNSGNSTSFSFIAPDLDLSKTYYYRAVAKGDDGRYAEGEIKSFRYSGYYDNYSGSNYSYNYNYLHSSNNNTDPEAVTGNADSIDSDSATLHGRVTMNDFDSGLAFLVYGEDKSEVQDVERENQFADISTDGDRLRKVLLASNLDTNRTFSSTVYNLNDNTRNYYRFCVAYMNNSHREVFACGNVSQFTTDRN